MALVDKNKLEIGQTIIFKSINQYDNATWKGTIVGFMGYELARSYEDIVPYYNGATVGNALNPIETLNYMVLKMYSNGVHKEGEVRIFAKEWIDDVTLEIDETGNTFDIRIFNKPDTEKETILTLLKQHGYSCSSV